MTFMDFHYILGGIWDDKMVYTNNEIYYSMRYAYGIVLKFWTNQFMDKIESEFDGWLHQPNQN